MGEYNKVYFQCNDRSGECFARVNGKCTLLVKLYKKDSCKFKKPDNLVTNGIYYQYNPKYIAK